MSDRVDPEVLIVGAGPAGLTAATYLGRFLRRVLVADGGETRADWIPLSHNMPGFPAGISGPHIVSRLREQAEEYGAVIEAGCVEGLRAVEGGFVARLNGRDLTVRAVLLATGVVDHHPDLPGVERAVQRALVRICPICDGYEARGKAVAVIAKDDMGMREAAFLRTYSDRVTLIHIGPPGDLTERDALARLGVALVETLRVVEGGFVASLNGRDLKVRAVLLATGVVDHHPDLPGVERAVQRALVRICPICDGYEARDKAVAVIGKDDMGMREAAFLRTYSDRVTLIHIGPPGDLTERDALARLGVALVETPIDTVELEGDRVTALSWGGGKATFDLVYSALGTSPNASLADGLGARTGDDGRMIVDTHQLTSIPGLYAAGDVVRGLNQIAVANAEAAVAATAIHNALRRADGQTV